MNRSIENNQGRANKSSNYAQAARSSQTRGPLHEQPLPQQQIEVPVLRKTTSPSSFNSTSIGQQKNLYNNKPKETTTTYKKAPVQLPMAPPTDTGPIQFGSINQPQDTPLPTTVGKSGDIPILRSSDVQFGSLPITDTSLNYRATQNRHQQQQQQQQQPKSDIPRTTNDGRLFTQSYAPRQNTNQGEYNNNRYLGNSYNKTNSYRPQQPQLQPQQQQQQQQTSPNHHPSPQQQQQHSPQTLPNSPMSVHRSPNMNNNYQKKNNLSPHITQQNIQMAATSWSPNQQQFFYSQQYPVSVPPSYNVIPTNRPPIIPSPSPRKAIAIVDPLTGATLNTSPMSLSSGSTAHISYNSKHEEKLDFKVPTPHVSKAVDIVDPAIRNREIREQKEREEAAQEALRKAKEEEERKEEEKRKELERIENERLAEIEKQRIETERRLAAEQEAIERAEAEAKRLEEEAKKKEEEEEARRKAEAEKETKRVLEEIEAKRRREEQDRIIASEVEKATNNNTTTIKIIDDPSTIQYPSGIQAPSTVSNGKLAYSIEFLLQFQQVCLVTEKDLSGITADVSSEGSRGNNPNMRQSSDRSKGPRTPGSSILPSNGINMGGDQMFKMGSRDGRMEMGKFNMGRPLTARVGSNNHMERQGSNRGGMVNNNMNNRGGRGGGSGMKIIRNPPQTQGAPTIPFEQVAPLEKSENRWVPTVQVNTNNNGLNAEGEAEIIPQELIVRKVNALLNKLTMEKFDSIATQIFEYAKQSAKETNGRSLRTVMKLTFEKACDEPAFATMWAKLCRSMYDSMTDEIKDTSILNEANEPSSGVLLFRKYLFNRCQVEFEKGWKVNMPKIEDVDGMLTEEYYIAAKAKRQGLGLIQFIGELFKLDMLSERIMYSCVIRLCNNAATAGDEEAESLCKLLTTIGKSLDSKPKTSKWLGVIMDRMGNEMIESPNLSSRIKFMIQNLLDLRKDKWIPRSGGTQVGPTTIAKIHEMAEKAKEEKDAVNMKRNNSSRGQYIPNANNNNNNQFNNNMSRSGSYRGGRDQQHYFQPHNNINNNNNNNNSNNNSNNNNNNGGDGWSTVSTPGGNGINKSRTNNDLSNFGKVDRSRNNKSNILGPGNSPFPSLSRPKSAFNTDNKSSGDVRSTSATNMFSALEKADERKKLQLLPKTVEPESVPVESPKPTDEEIKRKCKNILEEYFNIRDKKELSECVKELDDSHHIVLFIGEMLAVVEKKAEDVERMIEVIQILDLEKDLYIKAFKQFMEGYDDLTIDVPQAPKYVAQLLLACSIKPEEVDNEGFDSLKNAYEKLEVDSK
ncbi:hypothetical protein BD770DRAFT_468441 [Pilaira anomala]|nr:hypothetical protein BD770DRAFT_468441 [Pilaira anomala]